MFIVATLSAQTTPRFGTTTSSDKTGRVITYAYLTPSYDDTLTVAPKSSETYVKVGNLTGACLFNVATTNAKVCDKVYVMFYGTDARTITWGADIVYVSSTLAVDSAQKANAVFMFDGTKWQEVSRAKQ